MATGIMKSLAGASVNEIWKQTLHKINQVKDFRKVILESSILVLLTFFEVPNLLT